MRRILAFAAVALSMAAGPALAQEYRFSANVARGYSDRPIDLPNIQMQRRAQPIPSQIAQAFDLRQQLLFAGLAPQPLASGGKLE